jgi:hypothetical protein
MPEYQPITVHLPIHAHAADIINRLGAWQREMREAGLNVSTSPSIAELLHNYMEAGPDVFYGVIVHMEINPIKEPPNAN